MRKKDGEFLNCYVDKSTNEAFSAVAKLLGKTKMSNYSLFNMPKMY